jgi:predicted amidophosphoribosyltransferase
MLGQGYRVLKKWKLHRGPVFDRQVLVSNASLLANWKSLNVKAIIPIPQHFFRSWKMRGSPVEVIAQWVSAQTQLPIQRTLNMGTIQRSTKRQAQRNLGERLASRKNRFTINPSLKSLPSSVLLVDDFMTTGRTLNEAAQTLKNAGVQQIHAFCLGVRVFSSFRNFN